MKDTIYSELRDRILHIDYAPGQILNEQNLAKEFGVSRTPLRAVLLRLEWEQLIKTLPRTGILVTELELNTIMNVFQARLELEEVVGRLAAQRFDGASRDTLVRLAADVDALHGDKDPRSLAAIDRAIKELFHEAAANPFLIEMSARLYALTFRLWYYTMLKMSHEEWNSEVKDLSEEITDLIAVFDSGDTDTVGSLRKRQLMKHLKRIRATFLGLSGAF